MPFSKITGTKLHLYLNLNPGLILVFHLICPYGRIWYWQLHHINSKWHCIHWILLVKTLLNNIYAYVVKIRTWLSFYPLLKSWSSSTILARTDFITSCCAKLSISYRVNFNTWLHASVYFLLIGNMVNLEWNSLVQ